MQQYSSKRSLTPVVIHPFVPMLNKNSPPSSILIPLMTFFTIHHSHTSFICVHAHIHRSCFLRPPISHAYLVLLESFRCTMLHCLRSPSADLLILSSLRDSCPVRSLQRWASQLLGCPWVRSYILPRSRRSKFVFDHHDKLAS